MPLKLQIGLTKKIGLPGYGSLGASCHVEVELDSCLLREDLDEFQRQAREAFVACRQAVLGELAREQHSSQGAENGHARSPETGSTHRHSHGHSNGLSHGHPNGHSPGQRSGDGANSPRATQPRRATVSQTRALEGIAKRQQIDLSQLLYDRYGVQSAADLSLSAASKLIGELKTPVSEGA